MKQVFVRYFPTAVHFLAAGKRVWLRRVKLLVLILLTTSGALGLRDWWLRDPFVVTYHSMEVGGQTREYRLVKSRNQRNSLKKPLLVALHGALDLTDEMAKGTRLDHLLDQNDMVLVYPQGRYRNWPPSIPPENPELIDNDTEFFNELCNLMVAEHQVDADRIYVVGVSQGGAMTNILVCYCSDRIAAAVCNCGWLPRPLGETPLPTVHKCPMMFIVGDRDRQVSPEMVRNAEQAFAEAGHPTEWLLLEDFGHGWAKNRGINNIIWNFLSSHSKKQDDYSLNP